jgi:hypothetical protein
MYVYKEDDMLALDVRSQWFAPASSQVPHGYIFGISEYRREHLRNIGTSVGASSEYRRKHLQNIGGSTFRISEHGKCPALKLIELSSIFS